MHPVLCTVSCLVSRVLCTVSCLVSRVLCTVLCTHHEVTDLEIQGMVKNTKN